jgi:hypothetical protein
MIKMDFIMGKLKHEIHSLSRDVLLEHEGDGLTRLVVCVGLYKRLHLP